MCDYCLGDMRVRQTGEEVTVAIEHFGEAAKDHGLEEINVRIEQPLDYYDEKRQQRVRNYQPMSWRNINWPVIGTAAICVGLWLLASKVPTWLTGLWR